MEYDWHGHTIKITGNWVGKYLYLVPQYELWLDDERLDQIGGPRLRPKLEAIIEDEEGQTHHINVELLSIAGIRPLCTLSIGEEVVMEEKLRVENVLNPFLVLFILASTMVMLYVGPDVLRSLIKR